MNRYVLSMMHLTPEMGAQLEKAARVIHSMTLKKTSAPAAARRILAIGLEAFFASPDVVAHLERYESKRETTNDEG